MKLSLIFIWAFIIQSECANNTTVSKSQIHNNLSGIILPQEPLENEGEQIEIVTNTTVTSRRPPTIAKEANNVGNTMTSLRMISSTEHQSKKETTTSNTEPTSMAFTVTTMYVRQVSSPQQKVIDVIDTRNLMSGTKQNMSSHNPDPNPSSDQPVNAGQGPTTMSAKTVTTGTLFVTQHTKSSVNLDINGDQSHDGDESSGETTMSLDNKTPSQELGSTLRMYPEGTTSDMTTVATQFQTSDRFQRTTVPSSTSNVYTSPSTITSSMSETDGSSSSYDALGITQQSVADIPHMSSALSTSKTPVTQNESTVNYNEYQLVPSGPGGHTVNKTFESVINGILNRTISNAKPGNTSDSGTNTTLPPVIEQSGKKENASNVVFTSGIPSSNNGNCSHTSVSNNSNGPPVTEAKFHVSGMNTHINSVGPWHGGVLPPLLIDNHSDAPPILQYTSIILKTVREVDEIDNSTFTTFSQAIDRVGNSKDFENVSSSMKKDLFVDIMGVAEFLFDNIADSQDTIRLNTATMNIQSEYMAPPLVEVSHVTVYLDKPELSVQLTSGLFADNSTGAGVRVSTVIYKDMDDFVRASNKDISSDVISVSLQKVKDNQTKPLPVRENDAIYFVMKTVLKQDKREVDRRCIFWNFTKSMWSTDGCSMVDKNESYTMCVCNHLTNFAILVIYMDTEEVSLENQQVLFALTMVGCSISIACLATALIAYIYLQMLSNEKVLIHANLSAALLMAQLVFVSSGDAYKNPSICKMVAILLHYFFMASFTWMMSEGLALYLFCTKGIFNLRGMRIKYFLLGWGLPALIVIISLAAKFPEYGNGPQYSCWLSVKDGLIWAFMGPMLAILLLNIFVLGLVVRVFLTLKANSEKTEVVRLRGSIRAMFTLMPLLGLTWIISLLVPLNVVFHYLFVIINTVQGMCIFFLHCICNDELRKKFQEKRRRWSTTRTASDAEMSHPGRRKRGSFDAIKTAAVVTAPANDYARRCAWK